MTKNLVKDLIERPIGASDGRETLEVVAAYLIQDLIKDPIKDQPVTRSVGTGTAGSDDEGTNREAE